MATRVDASGLGRVLVLTENVSVPSDRRVWQEARALSRAGYDVTVVCPQGSGDEASPRDRLDGIDIHRFALTHAEGGGMGYLREYPVAFTRIRRLVRCLANSVPFDVVHACNPPDFLFAAALPLRRQGAAFIFDHHDLVPELYLARFGRRDLLYATARCLERLTFRLADVVLATNQSFRDVALTRGHMADEDVFVVRNAPELEKFTRAEPDATLKKDRSFLLAYVGVINAQDVVEEAIHALANLRTRRSDWRAIFAGDGDALEDVRRLADELELDDVEFVGWRDDDYIVRLLSTADVCLSPEPSSPINDVSTLVKVAEYMAMSCPIVAYDLPESRFTAGEAAAFVPSGDREAFASAIDALLNDPERRAAMGKAGRQRVEHELSWSASENALIAAYSRALERAAERSRGKAKLAV